MADIIYEWDVNYSNTLTKLLRMDEICKGRDKEEFKVTKKSQEKKIGK